MLSNEPQVIEKMKQKALDFPTFQNEYYSGKKNDEDATKIATQPFWQSMRLSKRRMEKHDIVIEEIVKDEPGTSIQTEKTGADGNNFVGVFKRRVKTHTRIYKGGKKIYSEKNHKFAVTDFIKANVEGDKAVCPNCGGVGLIATYIDGCDYCGSKFSVQDFEEKVSAYSTEEHARRKIGTIFKNVLIGALIILGISCVAIVISYVLAIIFSLGDTQLKLKTNLAIVVMALSTVIPMLVEIVLMAGLFSAIIAASLMKYEKGRIVKAYIAEEVIPNFVVSDFAENLEYKLRNIHMAETANEVNVFANCDLTESVLSYQDVIECYMTRLEFVGAELIEDNYFVNANVTMRLSRIQGNKVKTENEIISVTLSLKQGCTEQKISAINRYSCLGCGSNVSLLNGGICEYCDTKLDYENYSFMIESYDRMGTVKNPYQLVRRKLIKNYVIAFLISIGIAASINEYQIYMLLHMSEIITAAQEIYNRVETLDSVDASVEVVEEELGYIDRKYLYQSDNAVESVDVYADYLIEEGFELEKAREGYAKYRRMNYINERFDGYHEIIIKIEGTNIQIQYEIYDIDKWDNN